MIDQFLDKWLGVPYKHDGRSVNGVDCYGLVMAYYQEVMGIYLPNWYRADTSRRWVIETMTREADRRLIWIDEPVDGDIALARRNNIAHHMGIYLARRILQVSCDMPVSFLPLNAARIYFGGEIAFGRLA